MGLELPGHSGEDRVGLAPTSRSCTVVASLTAEHEPVKHTPKTAPDASVRRKVASAGAGRAFTCDLLVANCAPTTDPGLQDRCATM
jgi:hypothetical protein